MTRAHRIQIWIASLVVLALITIGILALVRWQKQKAISLRGAVVVQDSDTRKQLPIAGVTVSAGDLSVSCEKRSILGSNHH